METNKTQTISVLNPIGDAVNKTKQILFDPFNLEKWFVIGVCAWLAGLGGRVTMGGLNFRGRFPVGFSADSFHGKPQLEHIVRDVGQSLSEALPFLVPIAVSGLVVGLVVALLVVWLKSRGQFMFLDCIIYNRAAVSAPWSTYKNEGNSLFGFRFVVWLATFTLTLMAIVPLAIMLAAFDRSDFKPIVIGPMVAAGFFLAMVWLGYGLFAMLTDDFVVPIMLLRRCGVIAAWKEFAGLLGRNIGDFILYLLVVLAAGIVLGMIASVIVAMGCCCFCCIAWVFLIPVVGGYLATVLLLPLRVWRRSYAVLVLAQFGAAYDVFALAQLPAPSEDIPSEPTE